MLPSYGIGKGIVVNKQIKRSPSMRAVTSSSSSLSPQLDRDQQVHLRLRGTKDLTPACAHEVAAKLATVDGVRHVEAVGDGVRVTITAEVLIRDLVEEVRLLDSGTRALPYRSHTWDWRGYQVHYGEAGPPAGMPVVLVHGFGGNVCHWRKLISDLQPHYRVLALDLLGFGESDKPSVEYNPHLWQQQVCDFLRDVVGAPAVLIGNSIGSQVSLYAASQVPELSRGVCCINVSGGMNQRGLYEDDSVLRAMSPVFLILETLLKRRNVAMWLFSKFKSKGNIEKILRGVPAPKGALLKPPPPVYRNPAAVHDELLDILIKPAEAPGAVDVFVSVFTGDPGPRPEALATELVAQGMPLLVLWGEHDPWLPPAGKLPQYLADLVADGSDSLADKLQGFAVIPDTGHCPQDDRPEAVEPLLLPWLQRIATHQADSSALASTSSGAGGKQQAQQQQLPQSPAVQT